MSRAAVETSVQVSLQDADLEALGHTIPRCGMAGSYGRFIFS